jgi:hypothetical protein
MKAFAALLGLALLASSVEAQSLKEKKLSERCGKQAAETFRKYRGGGIFETTIGQIIGKYEHHYNHRLNKCFYLEISDSYQRGKSPDRLMKLYDLQHENREIGAFLGTTVFLVEEETMECWVRDKKCTSEQEWRELIKPYMGD